MIRGRRARRPTRVFVMRPRRNTITYDYLVTNDAEWTSTFALGAATLSGKTIAVAPGSYTAKTISSFNPASTVRVISSSASNKPQIAKLGIDGSSKLTFESIDFVSSDWASDIANQAANACVGLYGAVGDLTFDRCNFRANYRGVIDDPSFDVTLSTYPEYASIIPVFNSSGVIVSFDIEHATVGDLMADGTYNMIFDATITGASATFTVSGGQITSTSVIAGGTSSYTDTTGTGIRSKLVTWTGQRQMGSWMPSAIRGSSNTGAGALTIRDCYFSLVNHAIKGTGFFPVRTIVGNRFGRIYQDVMSFGMDNTDSKITFTDNYCTRPFSVTGDPGDPHSDFIQFFMDDQPSGGMTTVDWTDGVLERNIVAMGNTRGFIQGFIIADSPAGVFFSNWRIVGNAIINSYAPLGIDIENAKDCYVANNTVVRWNPSDLGNENRVTIALGSISLSGNNVLWNNISESNPGSTAGRDTSKSNVSLGLRGTIIPYTDVFSNSTGPRDSISQIMSDYAPKVAYAGKGAFANSAYINHAARTTNRSLEDSWLSFTDLSNQSQSVTATSNWSRLIGGESGRVLSVSGGEWRVADDASGTNATSWSTSASTSVVGKFYQVRHTTASGGSATATTTLTVGSQTFRFESTTSPVATFTAVDNQITAYSSFGRPTNETGLRKFIVAVRFRHDSFATQTNIIAHAAASAIRLHFVTGPVIRFGFVSSGRCSLRPTFTPVVGQTRTHIIAIDTTSTAAGSGAYWATDIEGVLLDGSTPGSGGTFDTRSTAGTGDDYGSWAFESASSAGFWGSTGNIGIFAEGDGGGTLLDGAVEFLWMDWGNASYVLPDLNDATTRAKFTADNINLSNGSGPTGSQPKIFYTGNAAGWNAGLSNLGSLSLTLTKGAGTYV